MLIRINIVVFDNLHRLEIMKQTIYYLWIAISNIFMYIKYNYNSLNKQYWFIKYLFAYVSENVGKHFGDIRWNLFPFVSRCKAAFVGSCIRVCSSTGASHAKSVLQIEVRDLRGTLNAINSVVVRCLGWAILNIGVGSSIAVVQWLPLCLGDTTIY